MKKTLSLLIILSMLSSFLAPQLVQASGKVYYVGLNGDDTNTGLSPYSPWKTIEKVNQTSFKPGDTIAFEGGIHFAGTVQLLSDDQGTYSLPVTVKSYGAGRAWINGGKGNGIFIDTTQYVNVSNINVYGLGRKTGNEQGKGVYVFKSSFVKIDQVESKGFQKAGIHVQTSKSVSVTNVYAHDNGFVGINASTNSEDIYIGYSRAINNPGDPTITNNHSGNGILVTGTKNSMVEYCEAAENGWDMKNSEFNGPGGIWTATSDNITIQYCVSHDNKTQPGKSDGIGFDFDGGTTNSLMQYNYSYNNDGAGYLFCTYTNSPSNFNNTLRYCISENDGKKAHYAGITTVTDPSNTNTDYKIYNNIIYCDYGVNGVIALPDNSQFYNNIIYLRGSTSHLVNINKTVQMKNNCYWSEEGKFKADKYTNFQTWAQTEGHEIQDGKIVGIFANPKFDKLLVWDKHLTDPKKLKTFQGFTIKSTSPCVNKGIDLRQILDIGNRDFYGNPVGNSPDIGIHEYVNPNNILKYDHIPPAAPSVSRITSKDKKITGKAEPGSEVFAYIKSKRIGRTFANSKGLFSMTIRTQKAKTKVVIYAKDKAGNKSKSVTFTVR